MFTTCWSQSALPIVMTLKLRSIFTFIFYGYVTNYHKYSILQFCLLALYVRSLYGRMVGFLVQCDKDKLKISGNQSSYMEALEKNLLSQVMDQTYILWL